MKFLVALGVIGLIAHATPNPLFEECGESVEKYFAAESCVHVICFAFKNETVSVSSLDDNSCPLPTCEEGKEFKEMKDGDKASVYPACCSQAVCK